MSYDFESRVDRAGTGSRKWNVMYEVNPDVAPGIPPFSVADMEYHTAPEIVEGLKEYINDAILGYSMPTNQMKQAVCKWMKTRHNWEVKPEWLLNSSGVVPALFASVAEFTKPDEGVILFTPVYHPFYMAVEENNRALVECPLVLSEGPHYDIDFELLEKLAADPKNTACGPKKSSRASQRLRLSTISSWSLTRFTTTSSCQAPHTPSLRQSLMRLQHARLPAPLLQRVSTWLARSSATSS